MNRLIWVVIGLVTSLGFIFIMAPANLAVSMAQDSLGRIPDLEIGRVEGRIWSGNAQIQYRRFPAQVNWNLAALPLLIGSVSADIELHGDGLDAGFHLATHGAAGEVTDATALIDARYINPVSLDYGLNLSGQFSLTVDEIAFDNNRITSATGELNWPGGLVHIETPQQLYSVDLPALSGNLYMNEDNVRLRTTGQQTRLIDLTLKPDGWVEAAVSFAFMDMAGLPVPGKAEANREETAVLLEEKIL